MKTLNFDLLTLNKSRQKFKIILCIHRKQDFAINDMPSLFFVNNINIFSSDYLVLRV